MTTQPTPMHFPIDECAKCTVRGDMGVCLATRCSLHEGWYARTQNARITELESQLAPRFDAADMATAAAQGFRDGWTAAQAISAEPAGATEMENLQRTAVGWQERALRAERNWVVCRRWAIAGGAPVEKLGDDPDQPFHAASPAIEGESNV